MKSTIKKGYFGAFDVGLYEADQPPEMLVWSADSGTRAVAVAVATRRFHNSSTRCTFAR